ncbi:pyridoxal phosphate-dependent decarboxylase family protein [Methylopila turkensis]|uniref:L-2,4-diaminobutyrate decarboxylase n=1 Tax=Methylopila turkensis TaxID=1437816 RepID=A0A9W6N5F6_9HYPH|nr:aminotransferase class I/II-fold pyridoxal phosphate-dependent enzyme [Methylopila turkensis]GLK78400.1 L-2,4-diaminobutyrate decarboxylase [Methylopila turkensis]
MFDRPERPVLSPAALDEALALVASEMRRRAAGRSDEPVQRERSQGLIARLAGGGLPATGQPLGEVAADLVALLDQRARTDHPRFFAFIPSPVSPASWIGEALTAIANPHAGAWPQAEGPAAVEAALVRWFADAAGLPDTAGGLFVSGGSMANLTALVAARDAALGDDDRHLGAAYISSETHSSVAKALRIIGVAASRIRRAPVDADLRMDAGALAGMIAADRRAGLKPFAVVATAGSTNCGAIDPLHDIADVCAAERLWLHVDGAYGASIALCPEHRALLAGLERADSLSWDAHKWLFQTYGCGLVLVRDRARLFDSFSAGPDYLRDATPDDGATNFWDLGPELTRPARALKLWMTLRVMGLDAVAAAIGHGFRLAEAAEHALRATPDWVVATTAQCAIVTFRYAPEGLDDAAADAVTEAAARRILAEGYAAVGATRIGGRVALRICAIHPETTIADIEETVRRLDACARQELAALRP